MTNEEEPLDNIIYVDEETWEWLQARLAEPPEPNAKLIELMRRTRGTIVHVDPERDSE